MGWCIGIGTFTLRSLLNLFSLLLVQSSTQGSYMNWLVLLFFVLLKLPYILPSANFVSSYLNMWGPPPRRQHEYVRIWMLPSTSFIGFAANVVSMPCVLPGCRCVSPPLFSYLLYSVTDSDCVYVVVSPLLL